MSNRVIFGGLAALGAAVIGAMLFFAQSTGSAVAAEDTDGPNLVIEIGGAASGQVVIDLRPDVAPLHVAQITALAQEGAYDNVVFHRVIDGFMAQTGDVEHGKQGADLSMAGSGGSDRPDLPAEFSELPFQRGTVGMARSSSPDSGNSQFFIMFAPAPHLNEKYTVVGHVIDGMDVVDAITKGDPANNGLVDNPDYMAGVTVAE